MAGSCRFHTCRSHNFNSKVFVFSRTKMIYNVSYVIQPIFVLTYCKNQEKSMTLRDNKDEAYYMQWGERGGGPTLSFVWYTRELSWYKAFPIMGAIML